MATIHGMTGDVYKTNGAAVALTNEACGHVSGYTRYQVTAAAKRILDPATPIVVERSVGGTGSNWTVMPATGYTLELLGGFVVFSVANGATDTIRIASGKYFNTAQWGGFFNWKLDLSADMLETTTFGNAGVKTFNPGLKEFFGSAEGYWQDGTTLGLLGTDEYIIILYADAGAAKRRYECYGIISKDSIETPVDELVKESIDFKVLQVYYREG